MDRYIGGIIAGVVIATLATYFVAHGINALVTLVVLVLIAYAGYELLKFVTGPRAKEIVDDFHDGLNEPKDEKILDTK